MRTMGVSLYDGFSRVFVSNPDPVHENRTRYRWTASAMAMPTCVLLHSALLRTLRSRPRSTFHLRAQIDLESGVLSGFLAGEIGEIDQVPAELFCRTRLSLDSVSRLNNAKSRSSSEFIARAVIRYRYDALVELNLLSFDIFRVTQRR